MAPRLIRYDEADTDEQLALAEQQCPDCTRGVSSIRGVLVCMALHDLTLPTAVDTGVIGLANKARAGDLIACGGE